MTTYVIAQLRFTDRATYDRYASRFFSVLRQFPGTRVLAADEAPVVLEGSTDAQKVVLLSFPDEAAARRFLDSPQYMEIAVDRKAGAQGLTLLVKGFGSSETKA